MDINTLLSELVVIANDLDGKNKDISADVDAAIFLMSQDAALPRNKSLAAVVRENHAAVNDLPEDAKEALAISAATEIQELLDEVLAQDSAAVVAVLTSVSQSLRSILHPGQVLSRDIAKAGAKFLSSAEAKLSQNDELHAVGYRVGLIKSAIVKDSNG